LRVPQLFAHQGPVGKHVVIQVLATLPLYQLPAKRGFAHLARASEEHHFLGQVGLHTIAKVTLHGLILRLFD
jgi:hypothetical protein